MSEDPETARLGDAFLKNVGLVATNWSALEAVLERAILRHQGIAPDTGLVLTYALGFRSKIDLLQIFAAEGAWARPADARALKSLLNRIKKAYPKRNFVLHSVWEPTADPEVARCTGLRSKGRFRDAEETRHADEIAEIAEEIRRLGEEIRRFILA